MVSLNAYMHPRNIYKNPLNFVELSNQYPELKKYMSKKLNGKIIFNFKDRDGLRCLCTTLLKKDFDLQIIIPENTLVPTLPLRLNYILWIEDLLQRNSSDQSSPIVSGIDIGTGATCIYPLLIAKKNGWKMTGIDIADDIIDVARENVKMNSLDHLISSNICVMKVSSSSLESLPDDEAYDFCVCNPPFFDSTESELPLTTKKRNRAVRLREARVQAAGTSNEISSPGGEVAFIKAIIENSVKLQDRIKIYTTMIGCKSSVQPVLDVLKENEIPSHCETRFCQGRTMRWAVAWTFTNMPLKSSIPPLSSKDKQLKPLTWTFQSKYHFKKYVYKMNKIFKQLEVQFSVIKECKNNAIWKIKAHRNTWTGLRRRRREQQRKEKSDSPDDNQMSCEVKTECEKISKSVDGSTCDTNKRAIDFEDDSDKEDHVYCKRTRTDEGSDVLILEAEIELKRLYQNKVANTSIRVTFLNGQKEAPQQILQYFKNNLV